MNYIPRAKQLSKTRKFRLYETVMRPTALYGCEAWVLNQMMKGKEVTSKDVRGRKTENGYIRKTNEEI